MFTACHIPDQVLCNMQIVDKEAAPHGFASGKKALISLLAHERGHVMAIELASIRTPFAQVKVRTHSDSVL